MPVRKDYPIPECPKCGKRDSRVLNTYYTEDRRHHPLRECNFCTHRSTRNNRLKNSLTQTSIALSSQNSAIASRSVSQSDITPKTSTTDNVKPLQIHKAQLAGVQSLRTQCNLPGAEDVEASANRIIAISTGSIASAVVPMASTQGSGMTSKNS